MCQVVSAVCDRAEGIDCDNLEMIQAVRGSNIATFTNKRNFLLERKNI